jgi:lauroyl/myristoyl acyltransferase
VFHHWPEENQKKLSRHSYNFLGTSLLLILYINGSGTRRNFHDFIEIENETYWNKLATSNSIILTTGHIGVWELLSKCFSHHNLPRINQRIIVYRPLHNETTEAIVKSLRQRISQDDGMTQYLPVCLPSPYD